jgi:hypothetical protein
LTEARDAEWTPSKGEGLRNSREEVRHVLKRPRRLGLPLREPECGFIVSRLPLPSHNRVKYFTVLYRTGASGSGYAFLILIFVPLALWIVLPPLLARLLVPGARRPPAEARFGRGRSLRKQPPVRCRLSDCCLEMSPASTVHSLCSTDQTLVPPLSHPRLSSTAVR